MIFIIQRNDSFCIGIDESVRCVEQIVVLLLVLPQWGLIRSTAIENIRNGVKSFVIGAVRGRGLIGNQKGLCPSLISV